MALTAAAVDATGHYGHTVLKLAGRLPRQGPTLGMVGLNSSRRRLEQRLQHILQFRQDRPESYLNPA